MIDIRFTPSSLFPLIQYNFSKKQHDADNIDEMLD